jgi:basic membrane lipoprotein Med (substrate-binding protein (PBP1-ABC) superfamily)
VGPSGSGKSSVVAAGLIPRLRAGAVTGSDRWAIVPVTVGADPLGEVRAGVARAVGKTTVAGRSSSGLMLPAPEAGRRLVLVIDQFEQLFTAAEESRRNQFLQALATELADPDGQLIVILTLRADFYDRPLQHPEFSGVFVPGVVHVLPMTARELEAAVVEPAEQVGVKVEPALLAELVAETVARPGSLPLLQYALTELFEQRSGPVLTHAGYAALGGLRGVLTRRAEAVFLGLSADEQQIATQVFLRLVRLGRGSADFRRRLTLSELTDLGIDAVSLSTVLTAFGRHRLLTFDHDAGTGEATVEMAHEALLTEWERLAGWIDRHRAALRRRDALLSAVDEWELSGRNADYLLTGSRLTEFEGWSQEGSLQLTTRERDFLEAGLERRQSELAATTAQFEAHRRLQRSARWRLVALAAAVLSLGGAAAYAFLAAPPPAPSPVAYVWTSEGSLVSVQAEAGFDRAVSEFGLVERKLSVDDINAKLNDELGEPWWEGMTDDEANAHWAQVQEADVRRLADEGVGLIYVDGMSAGDLDRVARDYPETHFAILQEGNEPNVAYLTSVDSEPSYLAGAVAAMKSHTGVIGYIGGVDWDGIWPFQAGYEAGARAVDPHIRIFAEYLSIPNDFSGFQDIDRAREVALSMYRNGADVIFHAAGTSGLGLFDAATEYSLAEGRQVWAIGVDTDQYETVLRLPGATDAEAWRTHILTSVLKGIDAQSYAIVAEHARGEFTPGQWKWGLASGASDISYSGGFIDDIRADIEELKAKIIAGEIDVPCIPESRLDDAAALGIGPDDCHN